MATLLTAALSTVSDDYSKNNIISRHLQHNPTKKFTLADTEAIVCSIGEYVLPREYPAAIHSLSCSTVVCRCCDHARLDT